MCGIVGYLGKKNNALDVLIDGLKSLEYRGYDSAGVAYVYNNEVKIQKEVGKIIELEKMVNYNDFSNIGIGHTRWATHGGVTKYNSHPHKSGKITLVHNGIVENYEQLKIDLEEQGYVFVSETDTEVIAALIDKLYKEFNNLLKVINMCKDILIGSYALAIISDDEKDTIYATRKDSPLIIAYDENDYYIASDVPAILKYTNKYSLIENNEIIKISFDKHEIYDINLNKITKEILIFE
ncbi:MAG TPA: glutamine--fructose-6-phosphate aminotransferase, partial [Tenericutes bacterium]|nr:glutamine--fructose-6-phosphate aminotransferase [Mycoplasmatota bacterium]